MRIACSIRKRGRTITSDMAGPARKTRSLFRLISERFRPHWLWFVIGTACAAVTAIAAASYGYLLKLVVEGLERLADPAVTTVPTHLWWLIGIIGLAAAVRSLSLYGMTLANNTGVQRAIVDIQADQFDALTEGDFARLSGDRSGGFVSRFINDVNALREAGLRLANNLTKGVLTVIGVLITMLIMDWKLTLVLLLVYPIAFAPVIGLGNRVRKRSKAAQKQIGEVTSLLSESFQSARVVKAYGLEEYQKGRAKRGFVERSRLFLKVLTDKAAVDPILEITGGLALVGILALTAWRISAGDTSLGNFVGVIGANGGPLSPGTAYVLLHHVMGGVGGVPGLWGFVRGGMGADRSGGKHHEGDESCNLHGEIPFEISRAATSGAPDPDYAWPRQIIPVWRRKLT